MLFAWRAFNELSASRQYGFGPNPISFADLSSWLMLHEVYDTDTLIEQIQFMDSVWLKSYYEKNAKKK